MNLDSAPAKSYYTLDMNYASFWKRFCATIVDFVIVIIPSWAMNLVLPGAGGVLVALLYKPIFEASPICATPGKALVGIAVVKENGERLDLLTAFLRYLASFVSAFLFMIGYLMALFSSRNQTLHDLLLKTVVIHRDPPQVNFFTVWVDQMKRILNRDSSSIPEGDYSAGTGANLKDGREAAEIESLFKLYQAGAITETEYQEKKAKILERI